MSQNFIETILLVRQLFIDVKTFKALYNMSS